MLHRAHKRTSVGTTGFELCALEARTLMASTPVSVLASMSALKPRQVIYDAIDPAIQLALAPYLNDPVNFDLTLRTHSKNRLAANSGSFFSLGSLPGIAATIRGASSSEGNAAEGDAELEAELGWEQSPRTPGTLLHAAERIRPTSSAPSSQIFNGVNNDAPVFRLANKDIDWQRPGTGAHDWYTLNRFEHWPTLGIAYQALADARFVRELVDELASWSAIHPDGWANQTADDAPGGSDFSKNVFDNGCRAEMWATTYPLVVQSSAWTPAANTLLLFQLIQTARKLAGPETAYGYPNLAQKLANANKHVQTYKGLLYTASVLSFVSNPTNANDAENWLASGHSRLWESLTINFLPDASHREQSSNYTELVVGDFQDAYELDKRNGRGSEWTNPANTRGGRTPLQWLGDAADSYFNLLSPNGTHAGLSDSNRDKGRHALYTSDKVLSGASGYSKKLTETMQPSVFDIYQYSAAYDLTPDLAADRTPTMRSRNRFTAMPNAGYSVIRNVISPRDAQWDLQTILDHGPKGGPHGHYDLLSIESSAYGQPFIVNPGLSRPNTVEHSTLAIDNSNHARFEAENRALAWLQGAAFATAEVSQLAAASTAYVASKNVTLGRTVWQHKAGVLLVIDWASNTGDKRTITSNFNIPASSVSGDQSAGFATVVPTSTPGTSLALSLKPLLLTGQTAVMKSPAKPSYVGVGKVQRYSLQQTFSKRQIALATLITVNRPGSPQCTATATWGNSNAASGALEVNLTVSVDGVAVGTFPVRYVPPGNVGSIGAHLFRDANANGAQDGGDPNLGARVAFLDLDNDNIFDDGELFGFTDSSGDFILSGVPTGTHTIRQVLPAGWTQTAPAGSAGRSVVVFTGKQSSAHFGSR
jgi:hypothetical protein